MSFSGKCQHLIISIYVQQTVQGKKVLLACDCLVIAGSGGGIRVAVADDPSSAIVGPITILSDRILNYSVFKVAATLAFVT